MWPPSWISRAAALEEQQVTIASCSALTVDLAPSPVTVRRTGACL